MTPPSKNLQSTLTVEIAAETVYNGDFTHSFYSLTVPKTQGEQSGKGGSD
jgi:hypothetical protein